MKLQIGVNLPGSPSLLETGVLREVFGCRRLLSKQGVKYSYEICEASEDGGESVFCFCADSIAYRGALSVLALE